MCGIFGYIGKSKNKEITYQISNALFINTFRRGEHATGFWACEAGADGRIFYDKEGIKSTDYVNGSFWKSFSGVDADLFLGHCRQCSHGVGNQHTNKNNHPHVSSNKKIALVHNGRIPEHDILKNKYSLRSECDSEVLLAMYEVAHHDCDEEVLANTYPESSLDIAKKIQGMAEIFKYVQYGAMALAIGERDGQDRYLILHRDDQRPLHSVDLRQELGQIFFFSTIEIWKDSLNMVKHDDLKKFIPDKQEIGILDQDELIIFKKTIAGNAEQFEHHKYQIEKTKIIDQSEDETCLNKINRYSCDKNPVQIVSRLDEKENIKSNLDLESDSMQLAML